jgi:hypothetical protein
MAGVSLSETWNRLNGEQRVAGIAAVLLIVSTLGPFSFVEAAIVLTGAAVLFLLRKRAEGRLFHVPFGDGAVIAAAGAWAGLLIVVRLFDRPLGQGLLALVCAAILLLAGLREKAKRPPDDLPEEVPVREQRGADAVAGPPPDPAERETRAVPAESAPPPPSPGERETPTQETRETEVVPGKIFKPGEQSPLWEDPPRG